MNNPITVMTDKVMRMIKSMVYMAMRVSHRAGATSDDIARFLSQWNPEGGDFYHQGIVERMLVDLQGDGLVTRQGMRWYPVNAG
ncbi:hypothetical protein EY643_09275 [Halioglobus maricola]|uniref:Uncharacterized protein n=1 Tax=Halioglobus maricola TaxID=2601894 RepID=A0A5P9NIZ3_9GAMM|nr:hypothetical protein [Halioglobus maricola]QFU75833.1 hypothetical protein EY643_09275 [Halioglobus maricola]